MGLIKNIIPTMLLCSIVSGLMHAGGCTGKELRSESAPPRLQHTASQRVAPAPVVTAGQPVTAAVAAPVAPATHVNATPAVTAVARQPSASVPPAVATTAPKPVVTIPDTGAGVGPVAVQSGIAMQQPLLAEGDTLLLHDSRVRWGAALFIIWWYWDSIKKQFEPKKEDEGDALAMRSWPKKVVQLRVASQKQE